MWAGMYLASSQSAIPWWLWLNTTIGVALVSGAAATINHIIDHRIDALMDRTKYRPLASGKLTLRAAWIFALMQTTIGFFVLYLGVNPLTAILTLLAGVGYSVIYSLFLKRTTSQNIVIGGLSGAMPPLLGWTAVANQMDPQGWLLVLIIFVWTPPHFWALCIHRIEDYKISGFPMLPVTHGIHHTKIQIVLYTCLTAACSTLPYVIGMSGMLYLVSVTLLNIGFITYAVKLFFAKENDPLALRTFHYSLIYLTGLFIAILLDHHLMIN
jgi:protoheme IX farnesyltransferase